MRFTVTTVLSAFVAIASAQYTPSAGSPEGNPIGHPGLGELMTAGEPYTITWTPTTSGNVSLVLLQGPSSNVIPILTIVGSTENTGSYTWTVPTNLAPGTSGYGIQLTCDNGEYQYSPQCGIENADYSASSSTSYGNAVTMTLQTGANYTGLIASATSTFVATATGNATVPIVAPTAPMTVPSTLSSTVVITPTTASLFSASVSAATASATGAAVKNVGAGFGFVAGIIGAFIL